jgi:hypothetical protein
VKYGLKVKIALQSIVNPIQAEAKQAFVSPVSAINPPGLLVGKH